MAQKQEQIRIRSKKARIVYDYMINHPGEIITTDSIVQKAIVENTKQARYSLNILSEFGLILKRPDIRDCRSFIYIFKR